ncbi:MAG: DUF1080 domain-containing protein [Candidatus Thiothrix singaporensis]|uniref:DUF1080 domain-containing protein n=1 Tax=Candidatus Thiothrix singaporensis TaxID=2799669 RepID=A0A7L6AX56_9GAMM|nr:MAG: DUF1080 domain-containing protein [Candidatus Thiothrix singaporensis]
MNKMLLITLVLLAVIALLLLTPLPASTPIVKTPEYTSTKVLISKGEFQGKPATVVEYDWGDWRDWLNLARSLVGLGSNPNAIALLNGSSFTNGVIEADLASTIPEGSGGMARGFIGIAFRVAPDLNSYEAVYLRPANGRIDDPERRTRALQYISHPDFHFDVSRKTNPGVYETGADIGLGEWIKLRIEVDGATAKVYVNGQQLLTVNDLKLGATRSGGVALWVNPGSKAYFANLVITPK